ncbi:MAG: hypothetical protein COS87_03935 [Chloroflexi bacterium CG07_land_8_20_14_0_80_45_17]|nr:MAG: hypothetical protein COS87_03935 [Chloroflexi bacterium CG07_land_8_20_14_0_80_45_17]
MNSKFSIGDPIPSQLTDRHIAMRASSARSGGYCVVGASVRGRLHRYNEVPRDDAFAARSNGTWLAVAVSDGVGSRKLSRYGASFAVNRVCTRFFYGASKVKSKGLEEAIRDAFRKTQADIERFALKQNIALENLHCTLLGLFLDVETGAVGIGQIGDGLILGLANKGEAIPLIEPHIPEEVGATYVLTQTDGEHYSCFEALPSEKVREFKTFYLMTDGVADDCQYGPPSGILQRWANDMDREIRMFPRAKTAQRLKKYLATYQVKGSFDDRTLVIVYRQKDH